MKRLLFFITLIFFFNNLNLYSSENKGLTSIGNKEAKITVFRHKLLARALFFTSEIGSEISEKLYTVVAIALAYIYKLDKGEEIMEPDIEVPKDLLFNEDGSKKE